MRNTGTLNISPSILNGKVKKKRSIRITIQKSAIVIKAISIFTSCSLFRHVGYYLWDITLSAAFAAVSHIDISLYY